MYFALQIRWEGTYHVGGVVILSRGVVIGAALKYRRCYVTDSVNSGLVMRQ